jgi:hypothetical protein
MARTNADEKKERLSQMTVAFLAQLATPPDGPSQEADVERSLRVDGLADELLDTDAEGAILLLGDLVVRIVDALCAKTGGDRLETLRAFAHLSTPEAG